MNETSTDGLLNIARTLKKGNFDAYRICKRRLGELDITHQQYEATHQKLIQILEV